MPDWYGAWTPLAHEVRLDRMRRSEYTDRMDNDRTLQAVPVPENARSKTLRMADQAVNGDRNAQYGDPNQDFGRTAVFWSTYLMGRMERALASFPNDGRPLSDDDVLDIMRTLIQPHDVAMMQVLLKVSRGVVSPGKLDHYVDIAGYAACGADCADAL